MSQGIVRACPACGRKNRLLWSRLDKEARCGNCGTPLTPIKEPVSVDQGAEFEALIRESAVPVLVDFWAPWCGPCKMVAPEIAKVAEKSAGRILVVKVNTDVDPAVGATYRIQSIPTMAVFEGGREVSRTMGARPAREIETFLGQAVGARI